MSITSRASAMIVAMLLVLTFTLQGCERAETGQAESSSSERSRSGVDTLSAIRQQGVLRAGWAPYAPYASADPATGQPRGYYIDLMERVGEEAKIEIQWVETTWTNMISDMQQANKFDVMAAPVYRTVPRALQGIAFTRAIDYFGLTILVRSDDTRFSSVDDLNDPSVTLAVVQGEVGAEFASRHIQRAKTVDHSSGNISVALTDVLQGRADAAVTDAWTITQFIEEHEGRVRDLFAGEALNRVGAGWFVRASDIQLLNFLDTSIEWLESSGELELIAAPYELPSVD